MEQISENDRGLWCQSANNGHNIGTWYHPNGRPIPTENSASGPLPLQAIEAQGQVGLVRNSNETISSEGLYRCVIMDENNTSVDIIIAIYTASNYNAKGIQYTVTIIVDDIFG